MTSPDVVVIGGGPAGSTAAALLARTGRRVTLLERERFPRYHVGESLLSATLPILSHVGVLPAVERHGFIRKPGGTFIWGTADDAWSFWFREDPGGYPHAFHVVRAEFDDILLRHAEREGAEVHEETAVESVEGTGPFRIRARGPSGSVAVEAPYVVDASGQSAVVGRREGLREFHPFFKNLAIWTYFENGERLPGETRDNVLSAAHAEGWCWYIPLHDGTLSVGTVVDAARWKDRIAGGDLETVFRGFLEMCAPVARMLRGARQVAPVHVIRDYSYSSRSFRHGDALLAGDSACFIDPVFSTGVHLACLAGLLAADALESALAGEPSDRALDVYDASYRRAYERYRDFVTYFYNHQVAKDSYFWKARKLVDPDDSMTPREAFVRLLSGSSDLAEAVEDARQTDARWRQSLAEGRARLAPGMHLFRVAATLAEMRRLRALQPGAAGAAPAAAAGPAPRD